MSEWREYKIADIADVIGGGTPKTSIEEYWNGDIPWLSVVDFNTGKKYVSNTEKSITSLGLKKSSTKLLAKNDTIISARGTVGALAMLDKPMTFNQSCYGMRAKENTTSDYLFYLLKNTVRHLQQSSYGAVFDTITRRTFDETNVSLPPLKEQKAIAEVLSSLDDKIDLLHRQNKTLEELAQTLFRQWFIEEAKDEWEVLELGNFVSTVDNRGKTPPNQKEETPYPVIEVNALGKTDRLVDYSVIRKYVDKETFDNWFRNTPNKYDTLISTVGSIGELSMFIVNKGNIAQNVIALQPKNISPFYLYQILKYKKDEIMQLDIGGVQPSIKVPHLLSIVIPNPNKAIQDKFDTQVITYIEKMELNYNQIKTLEKMRDTLLPKLMSGEVRVKNG